LTEHLTEQVARSYATGSLAPEDFLTVDDHLSGCPDCRAQLSSLLNVDLKLSSLRNQFESPITAHLSYLDIEAYLESGTDRTDREILESHLSICADCADHVESVRKLQQEFFSRRESFGGKLLYLWKSPDFSSIFRTAAIAAMIGFVALILLVVQKSGNNVSQSVVPVVASLHDGGTTLSLRKDGTLDGANAFPQKYQELAKTVLQQQPVEAPDWVSDLHGHGGTLMGEDSDGVSIQLLKPLGTVIDSVTPQFEWKPVAGAHQYSVKVFDANFHAVASSGMITQTQWTPQTALQRGLIYNWKVTAVTNQGEVSAPIPPAPEAKFKILEEPKSQEIARFQKSNSHLLLGLAYLDAGMVSEANEQFQLLQQQNPDSEIVSTLVQNTQR
jgi:hypothetical protein